MCGAAAQSVSTARVHRRGAVARSSTGRTWATGAGARGRPTLTGMSIRRSLRRAVVALGATGSLVPGAALTSPDLGPGAGAAQREPVPVRRTWSWPLDPRPAVTARFVAPRSTYGRGHRGLDLAARHGQQVRAVDAGVVTHVGVIAGRGTVSVTHPSGLRSTYEPVRGSVTVGVVVPGGGVLGTVQGRTHCGGGCLHLGAVRGPGYVDPRPLLGAGPVVLLPLGSGHR